MRTIYTLSEKNEITVNKSYPTYFLRFLAITLFFMGCQNENDVENPKKTADQYFNVLKNDASFRALRDGIKSIANEAKLSNVQFYDHSAKDFDKLDSVTGEELETVLLNFTNDPKFVIRAEDKLRVLLQDFAKNNKNFVHEDPKLIDQVYTKLLIFEGDRLVENLKAAKKPDCGGTCNNQYYGGMESCQFNYDVSFATLVVGMIATQGGGSVAALAGYLVMEAQRSYCQSSALTNLSYCMDGCAGGNNANSDDSKDE